ncbi:MAG: short-chain fatty acid transporter [Syntrophus sp. (in: bacteria)]|nr:short-chain fatty acid transporter [Syntrophus sp. (in: bacteria)]
MLKRLASFFTHLMKNYLPDAYLFAILLTFLSAILALIFTGADLAKLITSWGGGIYGIVGFAFQMILILVTGHCLALTPAVNRILVSIAGIGNTPIKAGMIVAFVTGVCSLLNWGFGLIVGGLLALQVAKKTRQADFAFLIASAYSGYVIWHMGLSGSIPLAIATAKLPVNFIEQMTGSVVPVSQSIFQLFNVLPALLLLVTIPILMALIHPKEDEIQTIPEDRLSELCGDCPHVERPQNPTLADRIDHSYAINMIFGLMGLIYLYYHFSAKGFDLNLNIVIFIFFISGVILHGKPVNYVKAVNTAIKGAGGIALQFPLYGGIQGIMVGTGLAKVIATWFVALSSPETFYMFQFWAAGVINMFIPSGGGQWAAQGPITMEAAKMMGIDPVRSAMMVAWGDQWTNMIQPFWALPLLGLAGLSARDIMGYTTVTLIYSGVVLSIFTLLIGFKVL